MDNDTLVSDQIDSLGSITNLPIFSYLMVINEEGKFIFANSFDFETDKECETFSFYGKKNLWNSKNHINIVVEIISKLLKSHFYNKDNIKNDFFDFSVSPLFISLFPYHNLYFVAIYPEFKLKLDDIQKDFIRASLRGIATTFMAFHTESKQESQKLKQEEIYLFIKSIPVILYREAFNEENVRTCDACSEQKNCIPKFLEKKLS